MTKTEEDLGKYIEDITSDNISTRERAIGKLGETRDRRFTLPLIWSLINDDADLTRGFAALELGYMGDRKAVPFLVEALQRKDEYYGTRRNIVEALGMLKDKAARPHVRDFRDEEYGVDREVAQKALRQIAIGEIEDKTKRAVVTLGLFGTMFLGANRAFADNPADLTSLSRQYPIYYYKLCYDTHRNKWAALSIPLGKEKKTNFLAFAWTDAKNNNQMLYGNLATQLGKFNFGAEVTQTWDNKEVFDPQFATTIEFNNGKVGLSSVVNLNDLRETKIGANANFRDFTAYLTTPLKDLETIFGLTYNGKIRLDLAYNPETKKYFARLNKGIKTSHGTVLPELRVEFSKDKQFYGVGLGFFH